MFFNKRRKYNGAVSALFPAFGFDLDEMGTMGTLGALDIAWQDSYNTYEAALFIAYLSWHGMRKRGLPNAPKVRKQIDLIQPDWVAKQLVRKELAKSFSMKADEWLANGL